jgi:hypothetical protein
MVAPEALVLADALARRPEGLGAVELSIVHGGQLAQNAI